MKTIAKVLKEDLINPFSTDLASEKLYNLASGCPLPGVVSNLLLSVGERGRKQKEEFDMRIREDDERKTLFFDQIKRQEWKDFSCSDKKVKVKAANGKTLGVTIRRDILRLIAAKSDQEKQL